MRNTFLRAALLTSVLSAAATAGDAEMQAQIDALTKKIEQLEKKERSQNRMLSRVNQQSANDNIKWDIDFRTAYHNLDYRYADDAQKTNGTPDPNAGGGFSNPSLFTNRLWLGMGSKPVDNLFFYGQLAVYGYWGASTDVPELDGDNGWRASSRPHDVSLRLRQAYFVYKFGRDWAVPMTLSAGRRAATDGFLANHREGTADAGSPLAHITNMEVDAAMVQFDLDNALPGAFVKVVYGRAHDPIDRDATTPYVDLNSSDGDKSVDFIVMPMSLYNDGASKLMAQYALILNSKGERIADGRKKVGAGTTHLGALSYQLDGLNEEIDFLDGSTLFASAALSSTDPDDGYRMLGATGSETGYSFWAGFLFPDMLTDGGRFGLEYNWGSKYWTPMTWAEDSVIGSKIATRGSAYEGYWNIPIVGKNLSAQLRYTYLDFDYRANTTCYWDDPVAYSNLDYAQEVRAFLRYTY